MKVTTKLVSLKVGSNCTEGISKLKEIGMQDWIKQNTSKSVMNIG